MKKSIRHSLILTVVIAVLWPGIVVAQYGAFDILSFTGKYAYSYQQTPDKLVPTYQGNTGTSYSWERCISPVFAPGTITTIGTSATYTFTGPLNQTAWFRRKTTIAGGATVVSNVIKIEVVSKYWEDRNYVREHDVLISGQTDWQAIDQLPIGQKLVSTTYLDGLGRPIQKISKETATPAQPNGTWGDMVQFYQYDAYGRQPKQYLPYTTTLEAGKYKTDPLTSEAQYYSTNYSETSAYYNITYENSPLNRPLNVKSPGTSWAAGLGNSTDYDLNDATDNVQQFTIGYTPGSLPQLNGVWPVNTLVKTKYTDENGKQIIEYTNTLGQLVLTKTQISDTPADAYNGWICTYNVYDDFGRLRFQMQPEAVKWLSTHSWSFAGTDGQKVANELCFHYEYDEKGRNIIKQAPGAKPLNMLYDSRDRVVFMQDGNQAAKSPAEWTVNLYDDLDRLTTTVLYRTSKTRSQLQTDIDNAAVSTTVTINNPAQAVKDLIVDNRSTTPPPYKAQNSIELVPGFVSNTGDNFTVEINASATTPLNVTTVTYKNPISQADLNNPSKTTPVKYLFYDDYSFTAVKTFDNNFDNTAAYPTGTDVLPIATSKRTTGFVTGSLVRVLGTETFLATTNYFDDKGHLIQTVEDNIKSGKEVITMQYHWDGRLLSTHSKHTTAGSGYSNFGILTKHIFDKIGRVVSIQKKYGSNAFKTIASYDLDDMGRLKTKRLDPGYTGSGKNELELLAYSYNIQNNITGINKDYALKTPGKYDKWGNFFGLYLGYDKQDGVFANARLDGRVTGLLWNTQGDDNQRKYDYIYDNAGRLTKADFKEKKTPGDSWNNTKLDFSVGGNATGGAIGYDLNGNLLNMIQKGILIGGAAPVNMDNLSYSYTSLTNKLVSVTDNGTAGGANGLQGDFKDGANSGDDYVYDDNGNLIIDLNKQVTGVAGGVSTPLGNSGITYNFLDKPELINISGKGTIKILYDADGNKLQRTFTPVSGIAKVTTYINEYVYQNDSLSFINFEEGRIRVINAFSANNGYDGLSIDGNMDMPNGKRGAYDYFIRDYQQNVRMILTEETHYGINQATMEPGRAANEEPYFGQAGAGNEVVATRTSKPAGWNSNTSNNVSKLSKLTGHTIGPNSLLKVMAGDMFNAKADYYYPAPVTNNSNPLIGDIVTALMSAITGNPAASGVIHSGTSNISNDLNASVPFKSIADPDQTGASNIPRAYLNVMFFNERFEFVQEGSTALRVSQPGDNAAPLVLSNIKAPKNGYVYIYLSNENDDAVYFDNFAVSYTRGRIIEENHYYAFGLRIAGISSKKFDGGMEGSLKNDYLYNDKELWNDADLNWYDYGFRNYDAQIGRFTQLDPLTWDYPELTNYQYASNEPIANVDLDGLEALPSIIHFGQWFNLPQMLAPVVISAKLPAAAVKAGVSFGAKAVSTASSLLSIANAGLQQVGRGIDNTYVRSSPQTVERVGDNTLQPVGHSQVVVPGQQVMGPISWYEKLSGQRSIVTDDGFGNSVRLGVDDEGYATSSIVAESFEVPFVPSKTPFSIVKFLKGGGKGVKKVLPSLDATGKVHGTLPKLRDLRKYSKEELQILLKELRQSVKKRIEVTSKMGRDRGHGQRQGAEQDLIKSIEKYLEK